jgi:hypothetical protein
VHVCESNASRVISVFVGVSISRILRSVSKFALRVKMAGEAAATEDRRYITKSGNVLLIVSHVVVRIFHVEQIIQSRKRIATAERGECR